MAHGGSQFDLLGVPGVGRFLRWRHSSTVMRLGGFLVALVMIVHGLTGPQLAPKNLATVLTWLHFRGFLVLGLLLAGNLVCMACPFVLVRDLARRLIHPTRSWPKWLRNKWPALVLTVLLLLAYELLDLWADPRLTVLLILTYFGAAALLGVLFRGSGFCTYVCPLGQFNLICSLVSPLEVRAGDLGVCADCSTKDCLTGRGDQPGCEPGLFQPRKVGNMDCHLRLDCLRACPYDNVAIQLRLPASELWLDPVRSTVGRFSQRFDLAALVVVFSFGALVNAFGMVSPVYALESWLAQVLNTRSEVVVLGIIFVVGLLVLPATLLGLTGLVTRLLTDSQHSLKGLVTRYSYSLVPVGFGVWLSHFMFHFLTGVLTIVPVVQSVLTDLGLGGAGAPRWDLGPILPRNWLFPLEVGLMGLGWFGSLLVAFRIAERESPERTWRAFLPWAGLLLLLLLVGVWLMSQPMEMRGTFLEG